MKTHDVKFDGRVFRYFYLWFLGALVSILSLGLAAPYFQCKIKDYLCTKTSIGKAHLRYLVDPKNAMLNRLKASAMALGISVVLTAMLFVPVVGPIIVAVVGLRIYDIARTLKLKGLIFRAHNTTIGNIRCSFRSEYTRGASNALNVLPIWGMCFPFLRPFTKWYIHHFYLNNFWVGTNQLKFKATHSDYLIVYVPEILIYVVGIGLIFVFFESYGNYTLIAMPLSWIFASSYTKYALDNLIRRSTTLGKLRFTGNTDFTRLLSIRLTNFFTLLLTAGLAYPWTRIRELRYRMECTRVVTFGQERSLLGADLKQFDSFSDELEEVLDGQPSVQGGGEVLAEESALIPEDGFESIDVDL